MQVYGKDSVFDADRLIDLLAAFEDFAVASKSSRGDMDVAPPRPGSFFTLPQAPTPASPSSATEASRSRSTSTASTSTPYGQTGASYASNSPRSGSRPQYSSNGANATRTGSYSGVNGRKGTLVANSRGNDYQASFANGNGGAVGSSELSALDYNGVSSTNGDSNAYSSTAGVPSYSGQGMGDGSGRAQSMHPINGQGAHGQYANGQGNERQLSGQHASSSSASSQGSWGNWPSQVKAMAFTLMVNTRITVFCCRSLSDSLSPAVSSRVQLPAAGIVFRHVHVGVATVLYRVTWGLNLLYCRPTQCDPQDNVHDCVNWHSCSSTC